MIRCPVPENGAMDTRLNKIVAACHLRFVADLHNGDGILRILWETPNLLAQPDAGEMTWARAGDTTQGLLQVR